jgi:hypothetical protein
VRIAMGTVIKTLAITALTAMIVVISLLFWETRKAAIPGEYRAYGAWGSSTLTLRADHTFTQDVQFMEYDQPPVAPYPRHVTLRKAISGRWVEYGRSTFSQNLGIKPFISLVDSDRGKTFEVFPTSFGPVGLALGIEIDTGRNIIYWK